MNFGYNDLTVALVDLDAIAANIRLIKQFYPRQKFLLPVKANGYGHGAYEVALVAQEEGVDYLGVANIVEADYLQRLGIRTKIMILGLSPFEHIPEIVRHEVAVTAADAEFLRMLSEEATKVQRRIEVHIKVDTGMGRVGVYPDEALELVKYGMSLPNIEIKGIFSHLSSADMLDEDSREYTILQFNKFFELLRELDSQGILPPLRHITNSAGIVNFFSLTQNEWLNMIRPGIMVYGYPCSAFSRDIGAKIAEKIKIPLSLYTHITGIRYMRGGDYVSYGRTYRVPEKTKIAILSMGYADGYNRHLSNKGQVIVNGQMCRVIGRVCMDQTVVDIDDIKDVRVGQRVTVIGSEGDLSITAREIAAMLDTITYEVLTSLSKRVRRIYKRGGEIMSFDVQRRIQMAVELILEDEGFASDIMVAGAKASKLMRAAEREAAEAARETESMDDEKANEYIGQRIQEIKKKYRKLAQESKK